MIMKCLNFDRANKKETSESANAAVLAGKMFCSSVENTCFFLFFFVNITIMKFINSKDSEVST